jgi:protein gp37
MNKTKIEYLNYTWNPLAMRCTPISDGCRNCWHLAMAKRLAKNATIKEMARVAYGGGPPVLNMEELEAPLHLRKPAIIGLQFMGDLFHENVPFEFQTEILDVMAACQDHTFFILTKRPSKALEIGTFWDGAELPEGRTWPLHNVWLGVSVENQITADERIPILLQIPAAKRFVSVEPMLGAVILQQDWKLTDMGKDYLIAPGKRCLAWVICGGLSLPGGKIQAPKKEWVDSLIEQCDATGIPIFIKPNAKYPIERKEFPHG